MSYSGSDSGMSAGDIVKIVFGCIGGLAVLFGIIAAICAKMNRPKTLVRPIVPPGINSIHIYYSYSICNFHAVLEIGERKMSVILSFSSFCVFVWAYKDRLYRPF